ncbi:MAG: MMPL family transporter [Spirochaetaceae bacterium]|jgi:predicted RND superfamily exporter protein|nr:MMPL family transporter [Spirochaetaceae bacterium]
MGGLSNAVAGVIGEHPKAVVVATLAVTLFFAAWIPKAELDNDNYRFVPAGDPALQISERIDDTFANTNYILVGLERTDGTIFDADFLNLLIDYTARVEMIEVVERVQSLVTSDYIYGEDDAVIVEPLVPDGDIGDGAALKEKVLSWDFYDKTLVSKSLAATQVLITLSEYEDVAGDAAGNAGRRKAETDSYLLIRDMAEETFRGVANVYVSGLPVISASINESMKADLLFLLPLVIAVVLVIMYLPLKSVTAVLYALLPVFVSIICTMGAMPLFNVKLSVISTVIPVVLVAVGNSYGLHIIIHYLDGPMGAFLGGGVGDRASAPPTGRENASLPPEGDTEAHSQHDTPKESPFGAFGGKSAFTPPEGVPMRFHQATRPRKTPSGGPHKAFVLEVLKTVWTPVLLAMLTTLVSFLAFCYTRVLPIREFGIFAAFGVFVAYLTSVTFLPAVLILAKPTIKFTGIAGNADCGKPEKTGSRRDVLARVFTAIVTRRKRVVFAVSGVLIIVSVAGSFKLIVDNIFIEYFRRDTIIVKSDEFIRREFGGSKVVSVMLETDTPELMLHPDTLSALDNLNTYLVENVPGTGKVMSYTGFIKRMNQVLYAGNNDLSYYEIPSSPERYGKTDKDELGGLIANYLFFLADAASSYTNDPFEPTAIRSVVQLSTVGERDTNAVVSAINAYVNEHFPPYITVTVGGVALVEISTNHSVVQSVWTSMAIAFIGLFIIVAWVNRSIAMGFLGVLPLLIIIVINFAVMGVTGIKLNIGTAMIFSLTMGIGIDYTIHFLEAMKRALRESPQTFLEASYRTSGTAIITDAVSTGAGFAVLLFSRFVMLAQFGALVSLSLINSALVGLLLMPVLLLVMKPKFYQKLRAPVTSE